MSSTTVQKNINAKVRQSLKSQKPLCGECSGFNEDILLPKCKTVCSKADKTKASQICSSFAPSVRPLSELTQRESFQHLVRLVAEVPDDALRTFASLMFGEARTRKEGFHFGQKVYVRYRGASGSNYLSNFMIAYVMFVNSDYYRLMSLDGRCVLTFGANCAPNIFTVERFEKLRQRMLKANKLVDPDVETMLSRRFRAEEEHELGLTKESMSGNITTIDDVFKENKIRRTSGKRSVVSLIDLVAGAASGYDVKKSAGQYEVIATDRPSNRKKKKQRSGGDTTIDVSGYDED